jgi:ribose 5-phosphate isomerase B
MRTMIIAVGSDHGGFSLKAVVIDELEALGHTVRDFGAAAYDGADDYTDFAALVGHAIRDGQVERGVVLCGSGVGACIAANKIHGVRACVCHDTYSARQGVEHDAMNVLCLGARVIGEELARELVRAFMSGALRSEERFRRRLAKVSALEQEG